MKKIKTIDDQIEKFELKLKWYQTSVNLVTAHIAVLKIQRDKIILTKPKNKKNHHGFNQYGERY